MRKLRLKGLSNLLEDTQLVQWVLFSKLGPSEPRSVWSLFLNFTLRGY